MNKRGISLLLILVLAFGFATPQIYAQEDNFQDDFGGGGPAPDPNDFNDNLEEDFDDEFDDFEDNFDDGFEDDDFSEEDDIEELIEDAEAGEFDEFADDFDGSAGLTSNNPIAQFFDGFSESREEAIAEMEKTAEECNQEGNLEACEYFEHALEKYEKHVIEERKEVSPDKIEEEAEKVKRNIGRVVRDIAKNVDPGEKDDFVRRLVKGEDGIDKAHKIVAAIEELCDALIDLGAHEEAGNAGCFSRGDGDYKYLEGRRERWNEEVSDDVKKLLRIVEECADLSDDDIDGNWVDCRCDELGGKLELLCFGIAENEDKCDLPKYDDTEYEDFYCDKADDLVDEFMSSLPREVREALEGNFDDFDEGDFDRHGGGPECGGLDFRACMLEEAERHIQQIPDEECRERVREGIRSGDVEGRRDAEEIISKCLYEKFPPGECRGITDPEECARSFRGEFGRGGPNRGPGPGFDYTVCDAIPDTTAQLTCYKANARKARVQDEYYDQRGEFRGDYDREDFERRFREEHEGDYRDFAEGDYRYREYDDSDFDSRYAEHQALIDATINRCESEGKPWFCDGPPSEPCYCGKSYDYREYDDYDYPEERYYDDYEGGGGPAPYNGERDGDNIFEGCGAVDCLQGFHCEYGGCVSDEGPDFSPEGEFREGEFPEEFTEPLPEEEPELSPEPTSESSSEPKPDPTITGSAIFSGDNDNAFLRYYFRWFS